MIKNKVIMENITLAGSFASIFAFLLSYTSLSQFITSKAHSSGRTDMIIIDDMIYFGIALIASVIYPILSTWTIVSLAKVIIRIFKQQGIRSFGRIWDASPMSYIIGVLLLLLDIGLLLILFTIFLNEISLTFAWIASVLILLLTSYFYIEWIRKYPGRTW